jgi:hypothetical protein
MVHEGGGEMHKGIWLGKVKETTVKTLAQMGEKN